MAQSMIEPRPGAVIDVPEFLKVNGHFGFWDIAKSDPGRVAVIAAEGLQTTFGELEDRCSRFAGWMASRGIQRGDSVALLLGNETDYLLTVLACYQLGVYIVPVNWHLTAGEISYILGDSEAKLLVAGSAFAETATAAADAAGIPTHARIGSPGFPGFADLGSVIAGASRLDHGSRKAGSFMFYTSGTTGKPKGVRRPLPDKTPEQALATHLSWYMRIFGLRGGDGAHLVLAPLYHGGPGSRAFQTLQLGHTIVLTEKFSAKDMLDLVERHRITSIQVPPIVFIRLLQLPDIVRAKANTRSLVSVMHAGAPCPVDIKRRMIDWLGPVLYEYYAATEGGGTVVDSHDWLAHPGTVGRPYPVSRVVILDETGLEVPRGEVGMIYMNDGAGFEYFKAPEKTAASMRGDLFTAGDFGYLDADGFLYVVDRRVDLILSGGVNIYPAEIEAELLSHPDVADAAVFGIPDAEWGQRVQAVVQPADRAAGPSEALLGNLHQWCSERLAPFKRPRHIALGILPRTDAGKIARSKLRADFIEGRLPTWPARQ